MIIELIPSGGLGGTAPLRLNVSQIVLRLDDGTPMAAAAHYGPDGAVLVESAAFNPEAFQRMLKILGINQTVLVSTIKTAPPVAGARLIAGPQS